MKTSRENTTSSWEWLEWNFHKRLEVCRHFFFPPRTAQDIVQKKLAKELLTPKSVNMQVVVVVVTSSSNLHQLQTSTELDSKKRAPLYLLLHPIGSTFPLHPRFFSPSSSLAISYKTCLCFGLNEIRTTVLFFYFLNVWGGVWSLIFPRIRCVWTIFSLRLPFTFILFALFERLCFR